MQTLTCCGGLAGAFPFTLTFPLGDPRPFAVAVTLAVLAALVATTAVLHWGAGVRAVSAVGRAAERLARRPVLAAVTLSLGVLGTRAALLPVLKVPEPSITDEFSYLLLGDTFASGRITNPTHPRWVHFESMFIFHEPTYTSVYPVAQGLVLAFGQILGHPWIGVWLSVGVMCGTLFWMLAGWLPPRWALYGSTLAALQFGLSSYWINSYWGGAPAAIGGALALGALPRVRRRGLVRDGLMLGLGWGILANARPYEGLVLAVGILVILGAGFRRSMVRAVGAACLVLLVTGAAMAYCFWRVTGSPLRMPYQVGIEDHAIAPAFIWQPLRPEPAFRHAAVRDFHRTLVPAHRDYRTLGGALQWTWWKIATVGAVYLGPLMLLPVITVPCLVRDRRVRPLLGLGALGLGASFLVVHFQPHYAAPLTGLLFALLAQGVRRLWVWQRWGNPIGRYLVPASVLICLLTQVLILAMGKPREPFRSPVEVRLRQEGGRHLVIVRYASDHDFSGRDWVYNRADIDASPIVWARDMGPEKNEPLVAYYPDRRVWLLEPDAKPLRLSPYGYR